MAHRFDEAADVRDGSTSGEIAALLDHPDFAMAVPTPDHFLPLLYVAGWPRPAGRRICH